MENLDLFIPRLFLFSGIEKMTVLELIKETAYEVKKYQRTKKIYTPTDFESKVGFVISGKCEVRRPDSPGPHVVINTLTEGDAFGILAIFGDRERFPTEIYATKNSTVLFIKKEEIIRLIRQSPDIAMNVISFMSSRISFLNERIATFSGSTVETKLARHILSRYQKEGKAEIIFNCKHCSEAISAGRASVYRSLLMLENEGLIKYGNKKITIIDPHGLERISK